jgi:MYXO-CTERM domain-containing protein
MGDRARAWLARVVIGFGVVWAITLATAAPVWAAGQVKLKSTEVQEVAGGWHLFVTLELPKPPPIAHQSMRFVFTKTAEYERALVDNKKDPVTNRVVLQNQLPSVESLDVDFSDTSGKIFKGTRFDFTLTRTRGYVAGEYKLQVRTSDGVDIGGTQSLTLRGENPVIDRRAITFNAKDPKIKKIDDGTTPAPKASADETEFQGPAGEVTPTGSAAPFIPPEAYQRQPEEDMQVKPKGCGCRVPAPSSAHGVAALAGMAALVGLALQRRRR